MTLTGWAVLPVLLSAIALVVSYFSGPMLNYGDFARYGQGSFKAIKKGNFLGLPVNFVWSSPFWSWSPRRRPGRCSVS